MTSAAVLERPTARPVPVRRARAALSPVLLGLAALVITGFHVDRPAMWRDEAASVTMAYRDWPAFFEVVAKVDAVHALYYALLHVWFDLVPYSPFTLRLPSVIATGATAAVVTLLGRRLGGPRAGIAAGALAAVLPALVWAGGEGRSYAGTALLAAASTLALLHALGEHADRRRTVLSWVGYGALLALTVALFFDAALLGVAHLVTMLVIGRRRLLGGVLALAGAALTAVPLLLLVTHQTAQVSWISIYGPPPLWPDAVRLQWFRSNRVLAAWGVALVLGAAVTLLRRRPIVRVLAVTLPWAALPPLVLYGAGAFGEPLYWPRYVTFTAPAVALLVGVLLASLPLPAWIAGVLVLALVAVPQIREDRRPRAKALSLMAVAARLVADSRTSADGPAGIIYGQYGDVPNSTTRLEAIAYPAPFRGLTDLRLAGPLARSADLFGTNLSTTAAVDRTAGLRTVWVLLDNNSKPKTFVPAALLKSLGFRDTAHFRAEGSFLVRWTREG